MWANDLLAQVSIQTDGSDPHGSAMLDVKGTTKGMLVPRVNLSSTGSASPITHTPETSLLVYNQAIAGDVTPGYYYWNGTGWVRLMSGNTTPLTGAGATNKVAFWTSATDLSQDDLLHWDNTNKRLGIGLNNPSVRLQVSGRITSDDHISTTAGNLHTNRGRLAFSNTATDPNHSIYNNYVNIDGEGVWDGMKMNVFAGLDVRTGNAATSSQVSNLLVTDGFVRVGKSTGASTLEIGDINTAEWRLSTGGYGLSISNDFDDNGTYDARMYLRNDGNVGIGATAPAARLDVRGTKIELSNSTAELEGLSLQTQYVNDNSNSRIFFRENANNNYGFSWLFAGADNPNLDGTAFTLPQNYLYLVRHDNSAAGNIAMGISRANGNVGIGIGNALEKLHVDGGTARLSGLSGGGTRPVFANNDGTLIANGAVARMDPLYIRGTGLNNSSARVLKIGATQIYSVASGRGLRLTVINKADHSVVSDVTYDTHGDPAASDNLATALNGMTNGQMGVLTSFDAWVSNVTANLRTAFGRLGLYKAMMTTTTGTRYAYAAIFEASSSSAVPSASAVEVEHNDNASQPFAEIRGWLIDGGYVATPQVNSGLSSPDGAFAVGVNSAGNVGVGISAPLQKLHVVGTGRFSSLASTNRLVYANSSGDLVVSTSDINPSSLLDGAGTLNYIPKWTPDGNTLGNSLLFDNGTSVGLGTTTLSARLHVNTADGGSDFPSTSSRGDVDLLLDRSNQGIEIGQGGGGNERKAWLLARHNGLPTYGQYYQSFHIQPALNDMSQYRGVGIGFGANTEIPVNTYLAVAGNAGIGTASPFQRLDVNGKILIRGGGTSTSNTGTQLLFGYAGNNHYQHSIKTRHHAGQAADNAIDFYVWSHGTDAQTAEPTKRVMTIDGAGSGRVGIGTESPATRLHISDGYPILSGNDGMLKVKSVANTGPGGCCGTETVLLQTSIDSRADDYTISGYGGDVRHILSLQNEGGRVAIGSVSAGYKLDVNGNTQIQGGLYTQGTASTLYGANASIYANNANISGGGIMVSDDGGFVDYNDGPVTFVGSTGLRIAGNSGAASSNAWLRVNGLAGGGSNKPVYADNNGTLVTDDRNWRLVAFDDFESGTNSWVAQTMGATGNNGITRETTGIHGLSYWVRPTNGNDRALKKFYNLSGISFTEIRIELSYYFLDSWDNENAWMAVGATESFGSGAWATPIWNFRWDHDMGDPRPSTNVSFWGNSGWSDAVQTAIGQCRNTFGTGFWLFVGASLDSGVSDETFSIDNVRVYVR